MQVGREISRSIELDFSADTVWQTITNTALFPEWNPFLRHVKGEIREGAPLEIRVHLVGGREMATRVVVHRIVDGQLLQWKSGIPGLFAAEHSFQLEPLGKNRTRFTQIERFRGLFIPLFWSKLEQPSQASFDRMNQALKDRLLEQFNN